MRRAWPTLAILIALAVAAPAAESSTLVDRWARNITLKANARGVALVTYQTRGTVRRVLAWGAVNTSRPRLRLDYSGGRPGRIADWRRFSNRCGRYTGPPLQYAVAACTMPNGTHWAVQRWVRLKPNFGGRVGEPELRVSHFTGPLATLVIHADWSKHRDARGRHFHHLFGRYHYQGTPIFGRRSTNRGNPLDPFGRNIYIESLHSDYGRGWRRVNGFLARSPVGQFCFEFGPKVGFGRSAASHTGRSSVNRYRAMVIGPGVTPDVFVAFNGPGDTYDADLDRRMNALQRQLVGSRARGCGDPGGRDG